MPAGRADLFPFGAELLVGFGQHKVERSRQVVVLPGLSPAVIVLEAVVFGDDQHHRKSRSQKQGQFEQTTSMSAQKSLECRPQTSTAAANLLHTVGIFFVRMTKIRKAERSGKGENEVFTPGRCRGASCFMEKQGKPSAAAVGGNEVFTPGRCRGASCFMEKQGKPSAKPRGKTKFFPEGLPNSFPSLPKCVEAQKQV